VALGSNLDDPPAQVRAAAAAIAALGGVTALRTSPLYKSAPLGGLAQPDYVNAVVGFLTTLSAGQLFEQLQSLEAKLGRVRLPGRWASRRIDLDLLVYGELQLVRERLTVPHPGIVSRNFVLYPLADIAPTLEVPGLGPVARLRAAVGEQGLRRLT
jgi:2-amino-4-hydroxy-6-hydroxymethyldihydropteridine diphosphokinase